VNGKASSLEAVAFLLCWSGFEVTDPDDLISDSPKFPVGALRSVFEDGNRVILRATESRHQDPLGHTGAVSSENCLRQIVTCVDIVDREAGSPSEHDGNVALFCESACSAGPPHDCDWYIGMVLTLRGNDEKRPPSSCAAGKKELVPALVLAEVVNALDVLKPSFRGEQFDGLSRTI
jgi:hypothetical protein